MSVHGLLTGRPVLPGFASAFFHAHELLFGYAFAVVTGFLVTQASMVRVWTLLALWLGARALFLTLPASVPALVANATFAFALAWSIAPQFLKGAKKWRNRAIAPLLIALALSAIGLQVGLVGQLGELTRLAIEAAVLLLAVLMLFMGGRIIAPAAAGAIERSGGHLEARVQPRIEGALLVLPGLAVLLLPWPPARPAVGALLLCTAGLALVRLLRWRLWACSARPDLWCLGIGYGWLVVGLSLLGLGGWGLGLPLGTAMHAITVGALGTLTMGVMARIRLTRRKVDPARQRVLPWIALTMGLAACLRLMGGYAALPLALAAGLWSTALLLLLPLLLRQPARVRHT